MPKPFWILSWDSHDRSGLKAVWVGSLSREVSLAHRAPHCHLVERQDLSLGPEEETGKHKDVKIMEGTRRLRM